MIAGWRRAGMGLLVLALGGTQAADAAGTGAIRIVGSSSMYAFLAEAAEDFGRDTPFRAPVIEATGTGGGFKTFCAALDLGSPDLVAASRPITPIEREQCRANAVTEVAEIRIGSDGVVLVQSREGRAFGLSRAALARALVRRVPQGNGTVPNPAKTWAEAAPGLPDLPIRVYGPPPTSGTRDVFVDLVMEPGCEMPPAAGAERRRRCGAIREDGAFVEAGEDDELLARRLLDDPGAVAVVGFGALRRHRDRLRGLAVDGVVPDMETLEARTYPLVRPLYLYVKTAHLVRMPELGEFLERVVSPAMIGPEGRLQALGLVPLGEDEAARARARVAELRARGR